MDTSEAALLISTPAAVRVSYGLSSGGSRVFEAMHSIAKRSERFLVALQLHWDQSVTPLPECRFPSTFAACLLVSARAILGRQISAMARDTASTFGSEGGLSEAPDWYAEGCEEAYIMDNRDAYPTYLFFVEPVSNQAQYHCPQYFLTYVCP